LLSANPDEPVVREKREPKKRLTKDLERFLERVTGSLALIRYRTGVKQSITFRDACDYWGVQDRTDVDAVQASAKKMPSLIAQIEQLFDGGEKLALSSGRQVAIEEVNTLTELHNYLLEQFSRHMNMPRPKK
jgi:hypothetical protein